MRYLLLFLSLVGYYAAHSLTAHPSVKAAISGALNLNMKTYRLCYSIGSTIGLIAILFYMLTIPAIQLITQKPWLAYIGLVMASWGVIVIITSFRQISGLVFLGLKSPGDHRLVRSGIHGHVRHPIYSGTILILIGMFAFYPSLKVAIFCGTSLIYLPVGIWFEEKKLLAEFGNEYLHYRQEVPAIFPRLIR